MSVRVGLVNRSLVSPLGASSTLKPRGNGGKKGVYVIHIYPQLFITQLLYKMNNVLLLYCRIVKGGFQSA